jgi:hypothetical protein
MFWLLQPSVPPLAGLLQQSLTLVQVIRSAEQSQMPGVPCWPQLWEQQSVSCPQVFPEAKQAAVQKWLVQVPPVQQSVPVWQAEPMGPQAQTGLGTPVQTLEQHEDAEEQKLPAVRQLLPLLPPEDEEEATVPLELEEPLVPPDELELGAAQVPFEEQVPEQHSEPELQGLPCGAQAHWPLLGSQ